ncbi:MAG: KTSC domain-containing protein [Methylovirgula sp.]|uniref:KTSC domain-containing protein n=1 Tax=Methylovirgula sp. TaxID=1978224 RepID=UPI0030766866
MKLTSVKSSNVDAVGHDADARALHVRFKSGDHYVYAGVGREIFDLAMASDSIGRFIAAHVKGKFEFTKLDREEAGGKDHLAEPDQAPDASGGHDGTGERVLRQADPASS